MPPKQPGEIYKIFTVDAGGRKYYLSAVDSRDDSVVVQEETTGPGVSDDHQLWYMVTADEQQQQKKQQQKQAPPQRQHQQQKPFVLRNKKWERTLVVASKPAAGGKRTAASCSGSSTQRQDGERSTTKTSKPAGDGSLQVVLGSPQDGGERWTTEATAVDVAGANDAPLRTCYIQRASNRNLVFKAVNNGGSDAIIKLSDKNKNGANATQFIRWTIIHVVDRIPADQGSSLSNPSMGSGTMAQLGSPSQPDTGRITADNGVSFSSSRNASIKATRQDGHQGDNNKGKK